MAQHDFILDNAAGAAFRVDVNAVLQAIATNNSGATEPATTYPNQWWYDTSTSKLKRRNNANDAWIILGLEAADTDGTLAANSDDLVSTQKATKTYVDGKTFAEDKISLSDNTTGNASTTKHGFLKKLSNVATEFMNGVGNWVAITIDSLLPSQTGNSGKFLTTNGSVSSWGAAVKDYYASPYGETIAYANAEKSISGTNYAKYKEITLDVGGSLYITVDAKHGNPSTGRFLNLKIYKNGSAFGGEVQYASGTYSTVVLGSISGWSAGDKVQLYVGQTIGDYGGWVKNLRLLATKGNCTVDID
jgi:hypothetical protein